MVVVEIATAVITASITPTFDLENALQVSMHQIVLLLIASSFLQARRAPPCETLLLLELALALVYSEYS